MKKLLANLVLTIICAITIALGTASAGVTKTPPANPAISALSDIQDCIDEEGKDNGYIVTIIEEPLDFEVSETKTPNDNFESRICYRNTVVFHSEGEKEEIFSELSSSEGGCSQKTEELANSEPKKYSFFCHQVQVLLSKGGTSLLEGYLSTIYNWAFGIVGLISVTVIIISAAQISLSGGDSQAIDTAKNRILKSLAGIVVLALSGLILYTINPNFFIK